MTPAANTRTRHDQAKLTWLRRAVQQGLDEIARGQGIEFSPLDELHEWIDQIGEEVSVALTQSRGHA